MDTSIPMSYNPTVPLMTPGQLMGMKSMMMQNQVQGMQLAKMQQDLKDQQSIREVLSQPGSTDQYGATDTTIQSLANRGLGQQALALQKQRLGSKTEEADFRMKVGALDNQQLEQSQKRLAMGNQVIDASVDRIASAVKESKGNIGLERIQELGQQATDEEFTKLSEAGTPKSVLDSLQNLRKFNPTWLQSTEGRKMYQRVADEEAQRRQKEAATASSVAATKKTELEIGYLPAREKRAEEELQLSRERVGIARQNAGENMSDLAGDIQLGMIKHGVPMTGLGRSVGMQRQALENLAKKYPSLTGEEVAIMLRDGQISTVALRKEAMTAATFAGRTRVAVEEVPQFGALVSQAAHKLQNRGNLVAWNKLQNFKESQLSDPDLKQFYLYMKSLQNTYNTMVARGGIDAKQREHIEQLFDKGDNATTIDALVEAISNESLRAQRAAVKAMTPSQVKATKTKIVNGQVVYGDDKGNWFDNPELTE